MNEAAQEPDRGEGRGKSNGVGDLMTEPPGTRATSSSEDREWSRRIGPEATRTRRTAVRARRYARGILIAYVAGLLIVFGLQGFRSTGERMLPNVLLFGSMIVVVAFEVVLTIREQSATKRLRHQVSAVLARGTGETRDVITSDYLLQMQRFDQWTARYKLRWFDGTVPSPTEARR